MGCRLILWCLCAAATGKFKEAAEHALRCYEFYLDGEQGRQDTDALTMYGTFLGEPKEKHGFSEQAGRRRTGLVR